MSLAIGVAEYSQVGGRSAAAVSGVRATRVTSQRLERALLGTRRGAVSGPDVAHASTASVLRLAQSSPTPTSTASGGSSGYAPTISSRTSSRTAETSVSGTSSRSSSCTWRTSRAPRPSSRRRRWIATIATLMMSAFEPCMTKLTASRSPSARVWRFERAELRDRPAAAEQASSRSRPRAACAIVRAMNVLHVREAREVRVDVRLRLAPAGSRGSRRARTPRSRRRSRS